MPSILITGANRGLGLEFARQYLRDGWHVTATCRNPDAADDLRALSGNTNLRVIQLDVTDDTSINALKGSVDFLKTQEKTANDLMSQLDTKIAEIDNKKIAVDAVRQATVLTGEEGSVNDKIEALNKEIDEMFVDVETALKVEEAKLTEMQTETSTADELLAEPTDLNATMAELDAILGTGDEGGN